MNAPFPLTPADAGRYLANRREMLLDAPCAYLASPENDLARSVDAVAERLARDDNAIFAIEVHDRAPSPLPSPGGRGSARLVSVAGVFREQRAKTKHRAAIWGVYTTPSARGKGFARAVVSAAVEYARTWDGVDLVTLSVSERAEEARRLYESLGFVRWGSEPDAVRVLGESFTDHYMHLRIR
jgi:RimJ/RimL family protein N-acetyltransferase